MPVAGLDRPTIDRDLKSVARKESVVIDGAPRAHDVTWHVGGLRDSGSHDVVLDDVFVPVKDSFAPAPLTSDRVCSPTSRRTARRSLPPGAIFTPAWRQCRSTSEVIQQLVPYAREPSQKSQ